jgi:hypothetical protein
MTKDTFYFSHDYNARFDEKIKQLIRKHSMLGYGCYWAIIEDLYNNANALRTDYDGIAFELRITTEQAKSIINDFDLFVFDGDYFGSASVERRLNERNEKSVKARKSAFDRWNKAKNDANALRTQSDGNAIKESKGNESKENKDEYIFVFKSALVELGIEPKIVSEWLKVRKNKKLTNTETAFNLIKKEIEKSGLTPNECIKIAVEKSWGGIDAEWLEKYKPKPEENFFTKMGIPR